MSSPYRIAEGLPAALRRTGRRSGRDGFSLVELLVVIGLIGIVGVFSIPAFQRYATNANLKAVAREIMSDINNTKQRAIEENNNTYRITFSTVANNYVISWTDMTTTPSTARTLTKSPTSIGADVRISATTFNAGGSGILSFQKRGTVTGGSVTLMNSRGSTAEITTNITGRAYAQFTIQ
jgi:prepilin-type N-terminal cleavage/methylation domain-containing protein